LPAALLRVTIRRLNEKSSDLVRLTCESVRAVPLRRLTMSSSPDLATPGTGRMLTAMFTDIVDSTKLKTVMAEVTTARRDAAFRTQIKQPNDQRVLD
jgi:hypothetical protein